MTDTPYIPQPSLADALAELRSLIPAGSPLNNRDPFGVWEVYLTLLAQVRVDDVATLNGVLPQGFPVTATGLWLDRHAQSLGLARIPAQRAEHQVYFSVRQPGMVPAGSVLQTELDYQGNALRFLVTEDTEVPYPGGLVTVRAEQPGTLHNVGPGRIQQLVTVLAFVERVTNQDDSLTVAGVDQETDQLLRERLLLRWPALGRGSTYHAYLSWAREVPGITKVVVLDEHPRGQGTVDVIVAPDRGLPSSAQLQEVDALVQARRPLTADVQVRAPDLVPLDIDLTIHRTPGDVTDLPTWEARVQQVLDAQTIGQTFFPSRLSDALHNSAAVQGVVIDKPLAPVQVSRDALVVSGQIRVVLQ